MFFIFRHLDFGGGPSLSNFLYKSKKRCGVWICVPPCYAFISQPMKIWAPLVMYMWYLESLAHSAVNHDIVFVHICVWWALQNEVFSCKAHEIERFLKINTHLCCARNSRPGRVWVLLVVCTSSLVRWAHSTVKYNVSFLGIWILVRSQPE
jgi:hypothetical protein